MTRLRAYFEGKRTDVRRTRVADRQAYVVTIDMTGLRRGIYVARVRYKIRNPRSHGGRTRNWTKVQYFRACYQKGDSPNQFTTSIL